MSERFLSCKCTTYGRVKVLEEAVYSFLKQDYPADRAELVIVNDYPLQQIVFDHPQVRIINLDKTFETIGDKENFAIEQCKGDIIVIFDDDDIGLPNHLQNINKYWTEEANLLHWDNAIFFNEPSITAIMAVGNSGIVYSRKAWEEIGRSPIENAGGDMSLVVKIHNLGRDKVILAHPEDKECSWIYRWGLTDVYHQSGMGTDDNTRPNIIQRHSQHIEHLRKQGKIPTGIVKLHPHWKYPYEKLLTDFINKPK